MCTIRVIRVENSPTFTNNTIIIYKNKSYNNHQHDKKKTFSNGAYIMGIVIMKFKVLPQEKHICGIVGQMKSPWLWS